ncbi:DUF2538 family protein (plasmid) [Alkalihalobacillus hwajinpoensis]|uniref:DUF2538 family protein n=1 Tax=Guptibacillus hwajinpoensis TaxID=208199 RepID=UPI001883FE7E|nr:DUF2538 family protein [Pseudalkalibacillus hwajinpoensis]MBF0706589.1 DUF2538 family protein [Pseudalkalibacillus hwajinpoensis]
MYYIDENHSSNFETVIERWPKAVTNLEYLTSCYILSIPMIYENVSKWLDEFETPVDWIWEWEWKYTLTQIDPIYIEDHEKAKAVEIPYDLTNSMIQLGKFSLNMWNSYEYFNLMECISSLDQPNYQAVINAIHLRKGQLKEL